MICQYMSYGMLCFLCFHFNDVWLRRFTKIFLSTHPWVRACCLSASVEQHMYCKWYLRRGNSPTFGFLEICELSWRYEILIILQRVHVFDLQSTLMLDISMHLSIFDPTVLSWITLAWSRSCHWWKRWTRHWRTCCNLLRDQDIKYTMWWIRVHYEILTHALSLSDHEYIYI